MLDVAPTEFLLVAFVALVVIGPKDLPKAMRVLGYWVGRVRSVGRQFRAGFDEMVREAELEEMEKKWAAENARIMREHPAPATPSLPAADSAAAPAIAVSAADHAGPPEALPPPPSNADDRDPAQPSLAFDEPEPQMVERPVVEPAREPTEVDPAEQRRDDERRDRAPS